MACPFVSVSHPPSSSLPATHCPLWSAARYAPQQLAAFYFYHNTHGLTLARNIFVEAGPKQKGWGKPWIIYNITRALASEAVGQPFPLPGL